VSGPLARWKELAAVDIERTIGGRLDRILAAIEAQEAQQAQAAARAAEWERLRTVKPIRLPLVRGVASGSALTLGGDVNTASGQTPVGPDLGYAWSVRHLVIEGLTAGMFPDVVNILRNGRIIWQLNGNQFCQVWSRGPIVLHSGETLQYQSVGTFAATGPIIIHGMALEVAAEQIGKFY
jgi:hypothetical protein